MWSSCCHRRSKCRRRRRRDADGAPHPRPRDPVDPFVRASLARPGAPAGQPPSERAELRTDPARDPGPRRAACDDADPRSRREWRRANPPKPPPPRPAGTQQVFEEACTLTQKWQRAREDELAVQYCQQAVGVELKWGVGCGDWDCSCRSAHPGYSEWHEERLCL